MDALILNGSDLSLEALYQVVFERRKVEIAPEAFERELRQQFRGVPAYEPTEKWHLTWRYVPFDAPRGRASGHGRAAGRGGIN